MKNFNVYLLIVLAIAALMNRFAPPPTSLEELLGFGFFVGVFASFAAILAFKILE